MRRPALFLLMLVGTLGAFACFVKLEGAACFGDDNCPTVQYCGRDSTCHQGPVPVDLACERVVRALATRVAACRSGDPDAYAAFVGASRLCASVVSSVDAGREAFDPKTLTACLSSVSTRPCEQFTDFTASGLVRLCSALVPEVEQASPCRNSLDCKPGFYCNTSVQCPGQCAPLLADGAPCDPAGAGCADGTTCFGGTCRAPLPADAGCNVFTPPCGTGLGCISNVCAPKLGTDGGCTVLGTECQDRFSCVGSGFNGRTCQPAKDVGVACSPGLGECGPLLWCGGSPAKCQPWAHLHETCGFTNNELIGCLDGRCVNNRCEEFLAPGEQCSNNGECGPWGRCAPVGSNTSVCRLTFCE